MEAISITERDERTFVVTVGEGRSSRYSGERAFPWVLQNMHRFFLYAAIIFIFILAYEAIMAFYFPLTAAGALVAEEPTSFKAWKGVSYLNKRHELYAWLSFFWVGFTDLYIRLVSMGIWRDFYITF